MSHLLRLGVTAAESRQHTLRTLASDLERNQTLGQVNAHDTSFSVLTAYASISSGSASSASPKVLS
jgi:hypothetical protein